MRREPPVRIREGLGVQLPRATRLVVLARYQSGRLTGWIEGLLEGRFRLTVNREKTRIVKLNQTGESLDFLGFTLRYHRDRYGRNRRYLNVGPSAKAMVRARLRIRELTAWNRTFVPIGQLIAEVNRFLQGWRGYFGHGHPRKSFDKLNWYVLERLRYNLHRRSQRRYRVPEGRTFYAHLVHDLGLRLL
jgi:RNA-directed DNA polymerase